MQSPECILFMFPHPYQPASLLSSLFLSTSPTTLSWHLSLQL